MIDLAHPLATAEFVVVDTETNGLPGDRCDVTEVGAVLVGGGELHDRWDTLCAVRSPLSRGIQRFTGITQEMLDDAPPAEATLPELAELIAGPPARVLVAHNASFDRRVLAQAFARAGVGWPDPPALCTVALARRLHPLARQRKLRPLAESLGIEVEVSHRALADAETCARVFCALFGRLCANAATIGEALELLRGTRGRAPRRSGETFGGATPAGYRRRRPDVSGLPAEPGVYIARNAEGQALYVGKSTDVRSRVRAHFAPSSPSAAWTLQAETVDCEVTNSELGALVLERRFIRRLRPPGNALLKHSDRYVYLRCRFDIPFPVLEIAPRPATGHAVSIGPLRDRAAAVELKEQLESLFELRHCGRALPRRQWPSAYGQMGRCLSPCLGDLDPNLYRRRLDAALALFCGGGAGRTRGGLLAHVDGEIAAAAAARRYERAAWLTRRRARLAELLARLGDSLAATHARPRLVLAPHPREERRFDAFWLVDGRVAHWGPLDDEDPWERTVDALRDWRPAAATSVAPEEVDEVRLVSTWVDAHRPPAMALAGRRRSDVERFVARHARAQRRGLVYGIER